ncbi:MAG: hypothetical protein ABI273_06790 [Lacunisphaera sp.]
MPQILPSPRCVRLALFMSLLAGPGLAAPATTKDLLAQLRKDLASAAGPDQRMTLRYADQYEGLRGQGRYSELEASLNQIRSSLPAKSEIGDVIDQLLVNVRSEMAEAALKQDAVYDSVAADFVAKFEAKASAADFDSLLQRLAALPVVASYNGGAGQKVEMLRTFISRWQDYLLAIARGAPEQAVQALNDLIQQSSRMTLVSRSRLAGLLNEVSAARNGVADSRLEPLQKRLVATIDSAKGAADFDGILADLAKARPSDSNYNRNAQVENLRRFAVRWQDYYSQMEAGNLQAAQNSLRELANNDATDGIYPRSRILARLYGNPASTPGKTSSAASSSAVPTENVGPIITPSELTIDNLEKFQHQLSLQQTLGLKIGGQDNLIGQVAALNNIAAQLKAGNPLAAFGQIRFVPNSNSSGGEYSDVLAAIRSELIMRIAPIVLEAPAAVQPNKQDSIESYYQKVLDYGRKHKDWDLVYRCLTSIESLSPSLLFDYQDRTAFKLFYSGLQQEAAGQWFAASCSYLNALTAGSSQLPVEEIGERLGRIKTQHPDDYAKAQMRPPYSQEVYVGRQPDPRLNGQYPTNLRANLPQRPGEQSR